MNENSDNKINQKERFELLWDKYKVIIYSFLFVIILTLVSYKFIQIQDSKKNNQISEDYIQAGIYLSTGKKKDAKNIYEDIIIRKHKFYSSLALSVILENELETEKNKIIKYFNIIENLKISDDQKDLIIFKKALYLLKISQTTEGNKILKKLVDTDSKLKSLAEEMLSN